MSVNKYSDLKLLHFPDKVASFKKGYVSAPIYVRIKPINVCNHSCWWCCYHAPELSQMHMAMETRDRISLDKMREIIDDLSQIGVKAVTYSGGGEPLIHPDIVNILEHTLARGLDLSIITNGSMLYGDRATMLTHAKWVRVSMDYSSPDELTKFRGVPGGQFTEIFQNLTEFSQRKGPCDLYVNYIVHAQNCHNLLTIAKLLKEAGVENVRFSPMWISPGFHDYHAKISGTVQEQLQRIKEELIDENFSVNTTYDLTSSAHNNFRTYKRCWFMQTVPVIGADQVVYACHNKAYDKSGIIGSIKDRKFSDLWFSDEAKQVFENLDPTAHCAHQCANDSKNMLVNEILSTSSDNFV